MNLFRFTLHNEAIDGVTHQLTSLWVGVGGTITQHNYS
jgi:hypothetical protein